MSNISDDLNYAARNGAKAKDELIRFYARQGFSHVLTLCWNTDFLAARAGLRGRLELARQDIRELMARVDRRLLGTRFHTKPRDQRTAGVFFFEHVDRNLHAHGLIRVKADRLLGLHRLFPDERGGLWNHVVPAGSYRLEMIDDVATTVGYLLKEQHIGADDRTTVWADEFYA